MAQGDARPREKKADRGLQPFVLTPSHTPTELREWKIQFHQFYKSGNMAAEDISIQQGRFSRYLHTGLLHAVNEDADENTPIYGDNSMMERLDREFAVLYPLFVRRMNLMKIKQNGEDARDYLQRINRVSLETDFSKLDRKNVLCNGFRQKRLKIGGCVGKFSR